MNGTQTVLSVRRAALRSAESKSSKASRGGGLKARHRRSNMPVFRSRYCYLGVPGSVSANLTNWIKAQTIERVNCNNECNDEKATKQFRGCNQSNRRAHLWRSKRDASL